jgi:hypothetical protein
MHGKALAEKLWGSPMGLMMNVAKAIVGLRPSSLAHVRWCERGAPVRFHFSSVTDERGGTAPLSGAVRVVRDEGSPA